MKKKGFTLVEVIVTLSITTILAIVISSFFSGQFRLLFSTKDASSIVRVHTTNINALKLIQPQYEEYIIVESNANLIEGRPIVKAKSITNNDQTIILLIKDNGKERYNIILEKYDKNNKINSEVVCKDIEAINLKLQEDGAILFKFKYKEGRIERSYEMSLKKVKRSGI